ncbi:glycogen [starch] synthase-like [Oppia nitens]|uniref:glycogen [starch] synthase-like n=1 Tax=Oppia nitens TaxID=1686743 RepID=UPI0023DC3DC4|nr:glycogen [starch] synthase-like [Oppia nitens]
MRSASQMAKRFYRSESEVQSEHSSEYLDSGRKARLENRWVFEMSTEVANKVGGIYTVIRSKSQISCKELGDQYFLVGQYNHGMAGNTEVEISDRPPEHISDVLEAVARQGIRVVYGHWLIDGCPQVLLVDYGSVASWKLDEWKHDFWNVCNIGIPVGDREANDSIIFGYSVVTLLDEFYKRMDSDGSSSPLPLMLAHFHEWMTGVGLIMCRIRHLDVATVFTTHATLLGRYLCAASIDFYNNLQHFQLDAEAGRRQIYHRYCLERAAAHSAHVFTTVSEITSLEAQYLLKRRPCIVTPNGLSVKSAIAGHEFQNRHTSSKELIHDFVRGHFFGHYDFDLQKTLYFFISGRYEFGNKGADMFIESLARLNHQLKSTGSDVTVVAFFIFPAVTNSYNIESLRGQAVAKQLRETIGELQVNFGKRLFDKCLGGRVPDLQELVNQSDIVKLKRCIYASQRSSLPPISTHNMVDDHTDPVLSHIRRCRLFNDRSDRVKVIFHGDFLSPTSPLFSIDYEDFVRGCNLGVFPSYYEPWGYTPAECTVWGIPSVTSNLSGFGCFISEHVADPMAYGIYIVDRRSKNCEQSVQELTQYMYDFTTLSDRQRCIQRNRTDRLNDLLDWKHLSAYYRVARNLALHRLHPDVIIDTAEEEEEDTDRPNREMCYYSRPLSEPGTSVTSAGGGADSTSGDEDGQVVAKNTDENHNGYVLDKYIQSAPAAQRTGASINM